MAGFRRSFGPVRVVRPLIAAFSATGLLLLPARALELVGGNINTTAPGSAFNGQAFALALPWDNVGVVNGASGIFLGDVANNGTFWVLTAFHAAGGLPGSASFGGTSYATAPGSYVRLANDDSSPTDLAMFRLEIASAPAGLNTLSLRSSALFTGEDLYYVGYGGGTKRWGFNDYESELDVEYGYGSVTTLVTDYDRDSANQNEAQGIGGDSGGAAFSYNSASSSWQLAGVILAVDTEETPNTTYSASVPTYRSQILAAAPEPSTALLLAVGISALTGGRRRRR